MTPTITTAERRHRLALRHHLTPAGRAPQVEKVAEAQVGLHSSDPATVYLSAWARMAEPSIEAVAHSLYTTRTLVRVLGMRRTMFVVPTDLAPLLHHGCSAPLAKRERTKLVKMLEDQDVAQNGDGWLDDVQQRTLAALMRRGQAVARELSTDVPALKQKLRFGGEAKWAGEMGISTRVLFLLATEGKIVRARPRGSWLSSQYRWAPMEAWLGQAMPDVDPSEARRDLAGRWLAGYGPGTFNDLKWWTGWTVRQTREALAANRAVEVALDEGTGWVLPGDVGGTAAPEPWVALLPGLDPTPMGWKERGWYFGSHEARLFDRNGNAGPTMWADGRVVGAWGQRPSGEIVTALVEQLSAPHNALLHEEVSRLEGILNGTVVTPRFRTPVERELAG